MATHEVSTWTELVTALTTSASGDTIKLTSDINCNREIPNGVQSTISCTENLTVDGSYTENDEEKNYSIINLRTKLSSPVAIFKRNGDYIRFKNIDFRNLILDNALVYADRGPYGAWGTIDFIKCRLIGKRTNYLVNSNNNYTYYESCFINVPYTGSNTSLINLTASGDDILTMSYCRIKNTPGNWTPGNAMSCVQNANLNGCYIYGTIIGASSITITNKYSYNSTLQNVVDCDLQLTSTDTTAAVSVTAPKGIWKNLVTNKDDSSIIFTNLTNVNSSNAIPESPSDMTNPTKLASDGFDVVVP